MAPTAGEIAIKGALSRTHGPYKNHAANVVDPLVTYFVGRGDSLVDIPLDAPSSGKADHERRWRAKLAAAGITDGGDVCPTNLKCGGAKPREAQGERARWWSFGLRVKDC